MKQISKENFMEISRMQGAVAALRIIIEHGMDAAYDLCNDLSSDLSNLVIETGFMGDTDASIDLKDIKDKAIIVEEVGVDGLEMDITSFAKLVHYKAVIGVATSIYTCLVDAVELADNTDELMDNIKVLMSAIDREVTESIDENNSALDDIKSRCGLDEFKDSQVKIIQ